MLPQRRTMKKFEPNYTTGMTFLTVENLQRTKEFYEEVIKLKLVMDQGVCLVYRVCMGSYIGFCDKLSVLEETKEASKMIFTLVVETREEVDAIYEQVKEKKGEIVSEPKDNPNYPIYNFFFKDPDGHLLEGQAFTSGWDEPSAPRIE
jgi:predicted lactoylglutathione lyase